MHPELVRDAHQGEPLGVLASRETDGLVGHLARYSSARHTQAVEMMNHRRAVHLVLRCRLSIDHPSRYRRPTSRISVSESRRWTGFESRPFAPDGARLALGGPIWRGSGGCSCRGDVHDPCPVRVSTASGGFESRPQRSTCCGNNNIVVRSAGAFTGTSDPLKVAARVRIPLGVQIWGASAADWNHANPSCSAGGAAVGRSRPGPICRTARSRRTGQLHEAPPDPRRPDQSLYRTRVLHPEKDQRVTQLQSQTDPPSPSAILHESRQRHLHCQLQCRVGPADSSLLDGCDDSLYRGHFVA